MKRPPELSFDKSEYVDYLRGFPSARDLAVRCNLWVMANLVRDSLPEYGKRAYERIREIDAQKVSELKCAISGLQAAARIGRRSGPEAAARWEDDAHHFSEILSAVKSDSRSKALGALHGKALPGALLYLVYLEEYIAAKTGAKPRPSETAHIVSALLAGLHQLQDDADVAPDLLTKKIKAFRGRKENQPLIEDMRRKTKCDSSGENELDRSKYGKAFVTARHRI